MPICYSCNRKMIPDEAICLHPPGDRNNHIEGCRSCIQELVDTDDGELRKWIMTPYFDFYEALGVIVKQEKIIERSFQQNPSLCRLAARYRDKKDILVRSDLQNRIRCVSSQLRKRNYHFYLKSEEWKRKRDRVMQRDNFICRLCDRPAEHVHHLTYDRIYNESDYDLVSLCSECHKALHTLDGKD